jgi:hypothetical protein
LPLLVAAGEDLKQQVLPLDLSATADGIETDHESKKY